MRFFFSLALKRLGSRIGLAFLLVFSFALTTGLVVCVPVFVDAMVKEIIREELAFKTETQDCPPFPVRFYAMPRYGEVMTLEEVAYARQWIADMLVREVGLPVRSRYAQIDGPVFYLRPQIGDSRYKDRILTSVQATLVQDVGEHIEVVQGAPFGEIADPGQFQVWLHTSLAARLAVQVGDTFRLISPVPTDKTEVVIRVAGIWEALAPEDRAYWPDFPERIFENKLLVTEEQYRAHILPVRAEQTAYSVYYYVLDDEKMRLSQAEHYIEALRFVEREVSGRLPAGRMDFSPLPELERGLQRKATLSAVLFGFALPLVAVLLYFMGSVSAMLARYQQREMAMLSSRGTGRLQILTVLLVETGLILLVACPLGILAGLGLARLMGYTQSFLAFVPRTPVDVQWASIDWRLVALGMVVSSLARLMPSWAATGLSVVTFEQWNARREAVFRGMRFLLIGILVLVTLYAYRQLSNIGSLSLIGWQASDTSFDPLLLLAPSLFLLTVPLLAAELFVLFMRPLTWIARGISSVSGFLGFMNLGREGGQYRTPIYMLVLCLSLGVFFASIAKSADTWLLDRRRYEVGADLAFEPRDVQVVGMGIGGESGFSEIQALRLPLGDYEQLDGVRDATRVGEYQASVAAGQPMSRVRLLAIDRTDFPSVTYFRSDYAAQALGDLMNRLAMRPEGILLPTRMAERLQLAEGDKIALSIILDANETYPFTFIVVGTFDYFPTMFEDKAFVAVTNLDYLESQTGGLLPYGIWMRLDEEADGEQVLGDIKLLGVTPALPKDLGARLERDQSRLERVGMFGMLSICFLTGAVLAGLGLLVYNFASLMSRGLRFAIWRAMGIRRSEVMAAVSVEYLTTLLYGVGVGTVLGVVASRLYVPFFRLTEETTVPVPPFMPFIDWQRAAWMAIAIVAAFVVVELVMLRQIARTRVFEVLRMGVRE